MNRFVTFCFSLILLAGLSQVTQAQTVAHRATEKNQRHTTVTGPAIASQGGAVQAGQNLSKGNQSPLAALTTDAVSYFQDTTGGNWWFFTPILNGDPNTLGYISFNPQFYSVIEDSIGNIDIGVGAGQTETHFDTMYSRILGVRFSTPTDLSAASTRLDSASISIFPVAMSPRDSLEFWVVPIEDLKFNDGNLYPLPDLFANTTNGAYIAKGSIKADKLTIGDFNTVTVNFNHKTLGRTRSQFGILVFVDGPDFPNDTVAYQFDSNLQDDPGTGFAIDTDGTIGTYQGPDGSIPMRTYMGQLDAGNLVLGSNPGPSLVGSMQRFFSGLPEFDENGDPTGEVHAGNLVMTAYISGTSLGVDDQSAASANSLATVYPNPVGASTNVSFSLEKNGPAVLTVYNSIGDAVATLVNSVQTAGSHSVKFNTKGLPNGMYHYRLQAGEFSASQNLVISK